MKYRVFNLLILLLLNFQVIAQDSDLARGSELQDIVDRLDILGLADTILHSEIKPYSLEMVNGFFTKTKLDGLSQTEQKRISLLRRLWNDEYEEDALKKGIFNTFYKNKRDLFWLKKENIKIVVNPVLGFGGAVERGNWGSDSLKLFRNFRGLHVRGSIFKKIGFFTEVIESQKRISNSVYSRFMTNYTLPGQGPFKTLEKERVFDFFQAKGYLTYSPIKQIRIKLGKDRNFFGSGTQSLLLNDFSPDYMFLMINTRIWKLEYTNLFTKMVDYYHNKPDEIGAHPAKYGAFHQLSIKPKKWLSFSVFESVIYGSNSALGPRGFELEYLNPLIFYRAAEQFLGSPDNGVIGFSTKVNFLKRFSFYGQFILDDFNWRGRDNPGFYGNKIGFQTGLKYINAFWVPGLDLLVEYNQLRPFTYSHVNTSSNYAHYGQFLGHSYGNNLRDFTAQLKYHPFPRWNIESRFTYITRGENPKNENMGANVFISQANYSQPYGNIIGQGEAVTNLSTWGKISYKILKLNAYAELEAAYRTRNDLKNFYIMGSLRLNLANPDPKI